MRAKMDRDSLLKTVKQTVREIEPDADIILYGSRSRGDTGPESDWDFLVLVDGPVSDERTDRIRHRLYEIEWESGEVVSSIVRNRDEWQSSMYKAVPFYNRVRQEGVWI
jgi:uncharacterized protein